MSESVTITKPVEEEIVIERGNNSADGGVDENGQKKRQSQQNESSMVVANDLIGSDDANVIAVSDATRTVIDMKIIAHEMWKLLNCKLNPNLTAAFASLPVPIHNAVTKTVVYRFQRRPANLANDSKDYSLKALFHINLLKKHKQKLTDEPLTLIGMKCAYCADHPTHIPGSLSFISINDINANPKILEDALHQRLLHLKNNCTIARQKHGSEVMSFFDDKYNKDDVQLKRYTKLWIKELKQNVFTSLPSSSSSSVLSTASASASASAASSSASASAASSASASASSNEIAALPQLRASVQVEPKINAGIAAAHNIAAMASHQRQLAQDVAAAQQQHRQQQQQQQYEMLQHQHQYQHQHQQRQQYPQPPLQHRPGNANYPPRYAQQYLNHQQQLAQQHLLQQQELRKQQQQLQLHLQQQRQIQAAARQQKPRQRQPQIFPRNKLVPFVELQQIYKDGWEDMTWSMFNPPYDSDDDEDDYFSSVDNSSDTTTQTNKRSNSFKESLPPLPPPKTNLDYCIPIQPYQLAMCPGGVPFLKEEEAAHTSKKVRGRRRQSSTISINVDLSDAKPNDVVMPSEGCPLDLAESLHNLTGNSRFMRLVSVHRDDYSKSSSETERLSIITKIVKNIARRGGSFLRAKFIKAKGTSRTIGTIDKEKSEYTRYRLEKGFPDILNPKIAAHKAVKTPSTKTSSANDNTEGDTATTATTATITSKVLEVEHAPKLGLIGGYLEWNNHGFTSNPKIKFSDLRKRIENTRGAATASATTTTTSANTAQGALNGVKVDTKKSDNVSASKGTIINTDTTTRMDVEKLLGLSRTPTPPPPPPPPPPQIEDDVMDCDGILKATGEKICNKPNGKKTADVTTNVAEKTGNNTQCKESQPPNNKRNCSETISCEETKPESTKKQRSDEVSNNSSPLPTNRSDVKELFNSGVTTLTS
ncbi:MAG: hypothetical protein ACI8RD_005399 [Bacillariaceae sp.]|jgi:hypothetical protein